MATRRFARLLSPAQPRLTTAHTLLQPSHHRQPGGHQKHLISRTLATATPEPQSSSTSQGHLLGQIRPSTLSAHEVFAPLTKGRPVFRIRQPIEIIREPGDFYQELLRGIQRAKRRIYLSSLYIGSEETELIGHLDQALAHNSSLQVHILLDCLRGTRTNKSGASSATLVAPLVQKYGEDRVHVSMYHTPALNGLSKRAWPQRYNETFGLQHIKLYLFDDETIISGANLSRDYFTNRQDRYMKIDDRAMADYFVELVEAIGSFSFRLRGVAQGQSGFGLEIAGGFPDPSQEPHEFVRRANDIMAQFLLRAETQHTLTSMPEPTETLAIPTVQMSQLGITQDESHMDEFFKITSSYARRHGCRNLMASAYFNFSDFHKEHVLSSHSRWDLLVASPEANGFYAAKGISKYIPDMYSIIEYQFLKAARRRARGDIAVEEYVRPGWTYHGKGVWCYLDEKLPQLTMIGSPNYGYRSLYCDLEAQVTLVPGSGAGLQTDIHQEALYLLSHSKMVNENELRQRIRGSPVWLYGLKPFILKKM
ncbi:CDP-diacylglycerol--glycerol-3-phosphate 3-phosphatidyltransferase [Kickxella alabastrina]|uniref:CDP-diacylglycerol--glycerol-3-phosphate 3-phosphatidyltransferase n=1 Tax=Kickxella alabastrina TaxID=61397 RepID=A0ACC1IJP9_9FUNG|nr:CDP-diacylglycerol--glycerol-3-phosphate 3-phosphatidyltransferase [Kickxella alabastrina]